MALKDHESGGAFAAKMREQLGVQHAVRKSRTCFLIDPDTNDVRKSLGQQGPRTVAFAAALESYRRQLEAGHQSGTPLNQILAIQAEIEAAAADHADSASAHFDDQPLQSGPSGSGGRRAVTQDSLPVGRGHGEGRAEVVRKQSASLVEKAAASLGGAEVDPLQVLAKAQSMLLDTFRKAVGREPLPEDSGYWSAYKTVIAVVKAEADRQGV
jgi:hypothetical protein